MTVADVIAALSRLPAHLPVVGVAYVAEVDAEGDTMGEAVSEKREVADVSYAGRFVELQCDGPYLP